MLKIKTYLRQTAKNFFALATIAVSFTLLYFYPWLGPYIFVGLLLWSAFKFKDKPEKYINERGYVVLTRENDLEHRHIAKKMLSRDLEQNEIVHHINGNKKNNQIYNLCLMDREKHELFHSWLAWKRKKNGRYPAFKDQKRILVDEYGGTLLADIVPEEPLFKPEPASHIPPYQIETKNANLQKIDSDLSKKLFDELRKERKRLADERQIPVYMVFDNKALYKMVETMPDTFELMMQVNGVGPAKLQMYGSYFVTVIKKFKSEFDTNANKKDSA